MKLKMALIIVCLVIVSAILNSKIDQDKANQKEEIKQKIQEEKEIKNKEDTNPPVITLKEHDITITAGIDINYLSLIKQAYDKEDGDLIKDVSFTEIDTKKPGDYTITYTIVDQAGNTASANLQVHVIEDYQLF